MNIRHLFVLAAIVCSLILFVIGFGWWDDQLNHALGWLGLALAFFFTASLPFPDRP